MEKNEKMSLRSVISLLALSIFLFLFVSGTALYTAPKCVVARHTGWTFLLISKESWEAVHQSFAFFFIVVMIFHIYYNWRTLVHYVSGKLQDTAHIKKEMILSVILTLFIFLMAAIGAPPVSWITELHESIKNSYKVEGVLPGRGNPEHKGLRQGTRGRGFGRGRHRGGGKSSN